MKSRVLAILLVLSLAAVPVAASAAPAVEAPTRSAWIDRLSDLLEWLFAESQASNQEAPPAPPPGPVAPLPTDDPQELNPEGGAENRPDMDPIG